MANVDKPSGLKPVKHLNGNPWNGKYNIYSIASGNGTATFVGDLVTMDGTADATGKYPGVKQTVADDDTIVGVAIGFGTTPDLIANPDSLVTRHRPASVLRYVAVVDDPTVIFEIQEDSVVSALTITEVGCNADVVVGSGNTTSGISAMELDSDNAAADAADLRIMRVVDRPDNELGNHCKWEVMINTHIYKTTTGS
jgi:hypothetical protein